MQIVGFAQYDYMQHVRKEHFEGIVIHEAEGFRLEGSIAVKVVPRFVTSPLFVGYAIPQVSSNLKEIADEVRHAYSMASPLT